MSRVLRILAASIVACIALVSPAWAATPSVTTGIVTDAEGWLDSGSRSTIEEAARSARSQGITVDVVLVPDFSGQDADTWCRSTWSASSMKEGDILYVIAYEQRRDVYCSRNATFSDSTLSDAQRRAEAQLSSNPLTATDAAAGANAFISTLSSSPASASSSSRASSSFSFSGAGLGFFLLFIFGGIVIFFLARRSQGGNRINARAARIDEEKATEAATQARSQLLAVDEQLRSINDELPYMQAQFGTTRTDTLRSLVATAQGALTQCFALAQQMNDAQDASTRHRLASQIMTMLGQSMNPLIEQQSEFARMRDAEASIPTQIAQTQERIDEARTRLNEARSMLATFSGMYPPSMLVSLQDNPEQAQALIDSASSSLEKGRINADINRQEALSALDTARRALMMAAHQLDAIFSAPADLEAIQDRLGAAIGSITSDLSDVTRLGVDQSTFAPLVADARAAIAEAGAARSGNGDPLAALEHLRLAEGALDAALAPARGEEAAYHKARASAEADIASAAASVQRAQQYVQGRRGGIDLSVRSLLSQAESSLTSARSLLVSDPAGASAQAASARSLAEQVLSTPISFDSEYSWAGGSSDMFGRRGSAMTGSSLGDALLWATIFSNMGGGGRRHYDGGHYHSGGWSGGSSGGGWSGGSSSSGGWSSGSGNF